MHDKGLNPDTKTGRIHIRIFKLLEEHPEGMQWVDLAKAVMEAEPSVHPKTLNGCIWKLTQTFPDKVHKPSTGRYQLIRYRK